MAKKTSNKSGLEKPVTLRAAKPEPQTLALELPDVLKWKLIAFQEKVGRAQDNLALALEKRQSVVDEIKTAMKEHTPSGYAFHQIDIEKGVFVCKEDG